MEAVSNLVRLKANQCQSSLAGCLGLKVAQKIDGIAPISEKPHGVVPWHTNRRKCKLFGNKRGFDQDAFFRRFSSQQK